MLHSRQSQGQTKISQMCSAELHQKVLYHKTYGQSQATSILYLILANDLPRVSMFDPDLMKREDFTSRTTNGASPS